MTRPTLSLICDAGNLNPYGEDPGFSIQRGTTSPGLTGFAADAGTLSTTLNNDTRALDPIYTASPFYPNLKPNIGVVANAHWPPTDDGDDYPLFVGTVDGWPQQYGDGTAQLLDFRATDAIKALNVNLNTRRPSEYTGQRIEAIINDLGLPIFTDIGHGDSLVGPLQHGSVSAWSHLTDMILAEWGEGYVDHNGFFTFRDRDTILSDARSSTPQAVFDNTDPDALHFTSPQMTSPQLVNHCTVSYDDKGHTVHALDQDSIDANGLATLPLSIPFGSPSQARAYARWIVARYKDPIFTFLSITLDPEGQPTPEAESALWVQALSRELGDLITVTLDPFTLDDDGNPIPSGEPITRDVWIRGVQPDFSSYPWTTTFYLQDASWIAGLFTLDSSEFDGPDVLGY